MSRRLLDAAALLARVALAALFGFAAYAKLSDPQSFADSVKAFKVLPDHLAILATFTIPWAEAICAALLLVGLWTRAAALLLALQLAVFIAGIASVLARKMDVTCGCFGKYDLFCSGPIGLCNITQNTVLLIVALTVAVVGPGSASLDRAMIGRPGGPSEP